MKFSFTAIFCTLLKPTFGLEDWVFGTIDATLPAAASDHTAVRSPDNGLIYLAGGCGASIIHRASNSLFRYLTLFSCLLASIDSPNGNVWSEDAQQFLCGSVTDAFFSFDPVENKFATLASLPVARYRHSSGVLDNKVWIIGGRNLADEYVTEVFVFIISTSWI